MKLLGRRILCCKYWVWNIFSCWLLTRCRWASYHLRLSCLLQSQPIQRLNLRFFCKFSCLLHPWTSRYQLSFSCRFSSLLQWQATQHLHWWTRHHFCFSCQFYWKAFSYPPLLLLLLLLLMLFNYSCLPLCCCCCIFCFTLRVRLKKLFPVSLIRPTFQLLFPLPAPLPPLNVI